MEAFLTSFNLPLTGAVRKVSAGHEPFKNPPCAVVAWLPSTSKLMAGEGGSRTHLSTCMDKPVLKTGRATGPYPPPYLSLAKLCLQMPRMQSSDVLVSDGDVLTITIL